MSMASYIGGKLYWWGYRMQPIRIRRAIGLINAIGLEWMKENSEIMNRHMAGERLALTLDLTTKAEPLTSALGTEK